MSMNIGNDFQLDFYPVGNSQSYSLEVRDGDVVASSLVLSMVWNNDPDHDMKPFAIIEHVHTKDEYRNRGLASGLVRQAIALAKVRGCYKIELTTSSKKDYVHKMYEDLGFDPVRKKAYFMSLEKTSDEE